MFLVIKSKRSVDNVILYDVYFVENGVETVLSANVGETVSYTYADTGLYTIKIVLKGVNRYEKIFFDFDWNFCLSGLR